MAKFKPCPFCGGTDIRLVTSSDDSSCFVYCKGCDCDTARANTSKKAIAAWNRRIEKGPAARER